MAKTSHSNKPHHLSKKPHPNSAAVVGIQLGDEGKGRVVDNKIKEFASQKQINQVYVVRSQGGSNAGHTVEKGDIRIGLHQLPSGIFYDEVIEILDSGMVIHAEDLLTEMALVEDIVGDISDRVILSQDAMLATDLQRAKEALNKIISGKAKGGTGRGMGPTCAEFFDKTGFKIKDLTADDWQQKFEQKYEQFVKLFAAYDENLPEMPVPDFKETKKQDKAVARTVGSREVFIKRLKEQREKLIEKDIVKDTFYLHPKIYQDKNCAVIFEMAQAVGLDPWFGTRPDRTSTPTTPYGILAGTRFWKPSMIKEIYGVMKATYMSSVGARTMPTEADNDWAHWVRETAHEYGTTTGRPRDICYLDLEFLNYNLHVADLSGIVLTHLDIAREGEPIKVCTGYEINGEKISYKPDMNLFADFKPQYTNLPGWDIKKTAGVTDYKKLPQAARDFVSFIEDNTGLPVSVVTTGPKREDIIWL